MAQRDQQKTKRSKLVRNAALVIVVLIGIAIIVSGMQNRKTAAPPVQTSTDLPSINPPPDNPVGSTSPRSDKTHRTKKTGQSNSHASSKVLSPEAQDAVSAAVLADSNLTLAQFQTASQRRLIINATVVPSLRRRFNLAYKYTGKALAINGLGYSSIEEARNLASYNVTSMMYHVDQLAPREAKISLFDFTSFRTHDDLTTGLEHKDIGITVLVMKRIGNKWLLVSASDGPGPRYSAGQTVKFQDKLAAYQPFLRGFIRYGNS